jgi:hypothetical protein
MRSTLLPLAAAAFVYGASVLAPRNLAEHSHERWARPAAADTQASEAPIDAPAPAPTPAEREAERRAALVNTALDALSAGVQQQSHPDALRIAFEAYYNYRSAHRAKVRNPYLYFVDYGLDSRTPRGYVFDMDALRLVDGPFSVAHGRGSDPTRDGIPTRFSNREGSNATSLGLYLTREMYDFTGKSGGRKYHSLGMRLLGLSGRFNSEALKRRVVVHGAPYVTDEKAGRSEGCPAMEPSRARRLLPLLSGGGLVFLFSPLEPALLREEPWSHASLDRIAAAE